MKLKRGLQFTIIISVFFGCLALSTAGLFDIFKKDPDLSPVGAELTVNPNVAPVITKFIDMSSFYPQPIDPNIGNYPSPATFSIAFVVRDDNGVYDLPNPDASGATPNIGGAIRTPVNSIISNTRTLPITNCISVSCANALVPPGACEGGAGSTTEYAYICSGNINYNDPSTPYSGASQNQNDLYTLEAWVSDINGAQSPLKTSGPLGIGPNPSNLYSDYIQVSAISAPYIPTPPSPGSSLQWNSLSLNLQNQIASTPIVITNFGNTAFSSTTVTSSDLIGTNNPSSIIPASSIRLSGLGSGAECSTSTSTQLVANTPINIFSGGLPYTAQGSSVDISSTYGCVSPKLSTVMIGVPDSAYTATWELIVN